MESSVPYLLLGVCICIALVAGIIFMTWWFQNNPREKRRLQKEKSRRIADFENGEYAKITGKVTSLGKTLIAPLSGRECVYYKITVEIGSAAMPTMGASFTYNSLISETKTVDFLLEQGNDSAHIILEHYDDFITKDFGYKSDPTQDAMPKLEAFLKKYGQQSKDAKGYNKTLRYREAILEIGEEVAVSGVGIWEEKNSMSKTLKLTGNPSDEQKQLIITDDLT